MTNTWLDLFLEILFLLKLFKFIDSIYFSVYSFDDTYTLFRSISRLRIYMSQVS